MPWKQGYTIADERTLDDADVKWPDNRQCAVSIVVDFSVRAGRDGIEARDIDLHRADFGRKVEPWDLLDVFQRYKIRATFAVPGVMAEAFRENVAEILKRGHEVAAHGYRHEDISGLGREEEKRRIELTTAILHKACGKRPSGWFSLPRQGDDYAGGSLSPNTIDLLLEAGYEYLGNGLADDIPHYWVVDFPTRRNILTLPYYYHFDDQFFLMFPGRGMGSGLENSMTLFQNWKQEFEAVYRRGRYFSVFIHPYLIQWGPRLALLERIIAHVQEFPSIWNATGSEVAAYWKKKYPASSFLKLKESTWKDYPGSLS